MSAPVAILAVGNASRGDDAVGPVLAGRLRGLLEERGLAGEFDLIEAYQLQVENSLDLEGRRLALFIDARRDGRSAVEFRPVVAAAAPTAYLTHLLEPATVMAVLGQVGAGAPPPAFALGVRATSFELGAGLTDEAAAAVEEAWVLLERLLQCPSAEAWRSLAGRELAGREAVTD